MRAKKNKKGLLLFAVLLLCNIHPAACDAGSDPYASARHRMIEHDLKDRDIVDPVVLKAIERVPRHMFVDENLRGQAYNDHPLPIGEGQTISQPYIVAFMTQHLKLKKSDRVLEIGTGSGYQAAVLAEIAEHVYTIEIVAPLAKKSAKLLKSLGYDNITVKTGDGFFGWKEQAPFDAIILTAAPDKIPQPLIDQLAEGGRLIAPVGTAFWTQSLVLGTKQGGEFKIKNILPVRFVPMTGEAQKK